MKKVSAARRLFVVNLSYEKLVASLPGRKSWRDGASFTSGARDGGGIHTVDYSTGLEFPFRL